MPACLIWRFCSEHPILFSFHLFRLFEKRLKTKPRAGPRVPSFKLPSRSLWLLRGPRWDDLFCFASLVPSVVRAGLSVPQHGNVMVARGGWRCFRSRWLVTQSCTFTSFPRPQSPWHPCSRCFHFYLCMHAFGGVISNWYGEVVSKFPKLWLLRAENRRPHVTPNLLSLGNICCRTFSQQGNI